VRNLGVKFGSHIAEVSIFIIAEALLGLWGDLSGKKDEGSGRMRA